MIRLRPDCLVFELSNGDKIPCSAEQMAIEIVSAPELTVNSEVIRQAAAAVLHYFRVEQEREMVSVGEFARALRTALRGLGFDVQDEVESAESNEAVAPAPNPPIAVETVPVLAAADTHPEKSGLEHSRVEIDLATLGVSACGSELQFFYHLRLDLTDQLKSFPQVLVCRGLRECVKNLCASRRWTSKCQTTSDDIVQYLRQYLELEPARRQCILCVM